MVAQIDFKPSTFTQLPPSNIEAEEAILGSILLDSGAFERVADILPVEAFSIRQHQQIYRAAIHLHRKGQEINLISVVTYLQDKNRLDSVGGQAKLALLVDRTITSINIDQYAKLVVDKWLRRCVIELGHELVDRGYDYLATESVSDLLKKVEERTLSLTQTPYREKEIDPDQWKYNKIVTEVRDIELKTPQLGLRDLKLTNLAKKYGFSKNDLMSFYFKSIIDTEGNAPSMSLADFLEQYGSEVGEWLIHGLLPKGSTSLLHAYGGVGKTRLSYDLIYHLVTGKAWNGFPVTANQRNVLLVQTDESPGDTVNALIDRGIESHFPIKIMTKWTVDYVHQLREEIVKNKIDFVVIDSLTAVNRYTFFSENDTEYARPVLLLKDLAHELGVHILILHHSNSEGQSRGTKAIFNSVSQVFSLHRTDAKNPDNTDRTLVIEKSRSRRPTRYRLQFDPETKGWTCLGEEDKLEPPPVNLPTKDRIVEFFSRNRNIIYETIELSEILSVNSNTMRKCCWELSEDKIINRKRLNKPGRPNGYFLAWEGESPPNDSDGPGDPPRTGSPTGSPGRSNSETVSQPGLEGAFDPCDPQSQPNNFLHKTQSRDHHGSQSTANPDTANNTVGDPVGDPPQKTGDPSGDHLSSEDIDQRFKESLLALCPESAWNKIRQQGATDSELKNDLAALIEIKGGQGANWHYRVTQTHRWPQFWACTEDTAPTRPHLRGKELISAIREIMNIPTPIKAPKVGDEVRYVGNVGSMQITCSSQNLIVLEVNQENRQARIKAKHWAVDYWVAWSDLKVLQHG